MVAQELAAYFRVKGITQEDIAKQLGVSQQYISGLLSGKKAFGKKQAAKFSETWGISPSWLLTGEGDMFKSEKQVQNIGTNNGTAVNGHDIVMSGDLRDQIIEMLKKENASLHQTIDRLMNLLENK